MSINEIIKKSIIPVGSAIVGGLVVIAGLRLNPKLSPHLKVEGDRQRSDEQVYDDSFKTQEGSSPQLDRLFEDDVAAQNEPFEELKKMRNQMKKRMQGFGQTSLDTSNPFGTWFSDKFDGETIHDISKREDESFVYYDIKVDDVHSTSINTKVEEGYVTITGEFEKKSASDGKDDGFSGQSIFKSSFNRTFPLPEDVDQNKMQMLTEKDKFILKFPKTKV